jgi:putative ABC transport system substrate-binding protein
MWMLVQVMLATTLALLLLAVPPSAQAQRTGKMPLVGVLITFHSTPGHLGPLGPELPRNTTVPALRLGLRDLGYVEGHTIALEFRFADGRPEVLPRLAAELVHLHVDVLVAIGPAAVSAAREAAGAIPVVAIDLESDPVQRGWVRSYARPGGNITGLFMDLPGLTGKWLELLREAVPGLARVAVLWDPTTGLHQVDALRTAARRLGVALHLVEIRDPERTGPLLTTAMEARPGALVQLSSPRVGGPYAKQIADFTVQHHLPAISLFKSFAEAGGLMAYGPNLVQFFGRLAVYVDKILRGAKPAELPVEQPTKFDLVLNLKTAQALGITFPPTLLFQADEVIQ